MRIAFLGPAPPFRGGISNFAVHLADELVRQGHSIHFFNFKKQYPALLFPSSGQYDGGECQHPSSRVLTPYLPGTWSRTARAIKQWQADLLIASWWLPYFAPAYGYILKKLNCRKVILAHNILPHEDWPATHCLLRYVFSKADRIVVLSNSCLLDLKRNLPNAIIKKACLGFHPIYSSVSPSALEPQAFPGILFFGLIKDYKGLDILLKAMPIIRLAIPDIRLRIAGSVYGSSDKYTELIEKLDLKANVECHFRYLDDSEVAQLFAISDVCVLPYKSATQSGVIATALSYKTPVIATDVGGLGEYIEDGVTGLLVPPDNPPALAAAVIRFYSEKLEAGMRDAIDRYQKDYSWAKLTGCFLDP